MARNYRNGRTNTGGPLRFYGGADAYGAIAFDAVKGRKSICAGMAASTECAYNGIPSGHLAPSAWQLPQKSGGMASRYEIEAILSQANGNLAGGITTTATLTAISVISSAIGELIASAVATLTATSVISNADGKAILQAAATITATGTISSAALGAIASLLASIPATASLALTIRATGNMAATISTAEVLSPTSLAAAVWNALQSEYVISGSMGEAMGAGGSLTPTQAAYLVELWRIHGLDISNPLEVTTTSREAGTVTQTIADDGTTTTVTRT